MHHKAANTSDTHARTRTFVGIRRRKSTEKLHSEESVHTHDCEARYKAQGLASAANADPAILQRVNAEVHMLPDSITKLCTFRTKHSAALTEWARGRLS